MNLDLSTRYLYTKKSKKRSMQSINISGTIRTSKGTKSANDLRKTGETPCVMYGGADTINFSAPTAQLKKIIYTPNFYKAALEINGKTYEAMVKEIQANPLTDEVTHVDFQQLLPGVKIIAEVPIKTVGTSPGVKEGGKLLVNVRKLKVKSTPENLKDVIEVDISSLKLGQSFKGRDLKPEGYEIMTNLSVPLVTIEIPRSLRSAATKEGGKK